MKLVRILDLGCGSRPSGFVNLDLFVGYTPHHGHTIKPENHWRFVQGDALNLPFRDNTFGLVKMQHCLEHLLNPNQALKEAARVAPRLLVFVPNTPKLSEHAEHLYSWSQRSLTNLLSRHYSKVQTRTDMRTEALVNSRFMRVLDKFPVVRGPLQRPLFRILGLELAAYAVNAP